MKCKQCISALLSSGQSVRSPVMLTSLDVQGLSGQTGPITRCLHFRISLTIHGHLGIVRPNQRFLACQSIPDGHSTIPGGSAKGHPSQSISDHPWLFWDGQPKPPPPVRVSLTVTVTLTIPGCPTMVSQRPVLIDIFYLVCTCSTLFVYAYNSN